MTVLETAQHYFEAWDKHDTTAVIALFAPHGTYSDPGVQNLTGEAIGHYVSSLVDTFPDLAFEIVSIGEMGAGLVAAEWLMKGTHKQLGKKIALPGADFIRVEAGKIKSVTGYFDSSTMQKQLGMATMSYPAEPQGPVSYGSIIRLQGANNAIPGAISLTWVESHSDKDDQHISEFSSKIAMEAFELPGFLGILVPSIGNRGYTISTWEDVEHPRQLLRGGQHKESMKWFFDKEATAVGMIGVWKLHHIRMMLRCPNCHKIVDADTEKTQCSCGEPLPETPHYL